MKWFSHYALHVAIKRYLKIHFANTITEYQLNNAQLTATCVENNMN